MENTAKKGFWGTFKEKHPAVAQFIVFFIISNGVTVLQMIMMPAIKYAFGFTSLVNTNFQILPIGHNLDAASTMYLIMLPEQSAPEAAEDLHISLQWRSLLFWRRLFNFSCSGTLTSNPMQV